MALMKIKPTPAELRAKYVEGVTALLRTQERMAGFTLSVGGGASASAEEDEEAPPSPVLPKMIMAGGRIFFDAEKVL